MNMLYQHVLVLLKTESPTGFLIKTLIALSCHARLMHQIMHKLRAMSVDNRSCLLQLSILASIEILQI